MSRTSMQFAAITLALVTINGLGEAQAGPGSHKVFNVQTYGATGNGTTDDTAAIQAALTAAANTQAEVYFPAGTYLTSSLLNASGESLVGQSGATLLANTTSGVVSITGTSPAISNLSFQASSTAANSTAINIINASNPSISSITIGGGASQFGGGVSVSGGTGGSISNSSIAVSSPGCIGIFMVSTTRMVVASNKIAVSNSSNIASGVVEFGCTHSVIQSNVVSGGSTSSANGNRAIFSGTSSNSSIISNTISGGSIGIAVGSATSPQISRNSVTSAGVGIENGESSNAVIANNTVTNSLGQGIEVIENTGSCSVTANTVSGAGSLGITAQGFGNVTVSQNALSNCGLTAAEAVILVNEPSAKSISITANQYKGNTANVTYFIFCEQTSPISTVSGNKTNSLLPTQVGPI